MRNHLGINVSEKAHQTAAGMASLFPNRFCSKALLNLARSYCRFKGTVWVLGFERGGFLGQRAAGLVIGELKSVF